MNQFRNMVFEGGGVKGIAYGGAIMKLDDMNLLSNIKRFAGTSAGAINATVLALGYSAKETSEIIANTDFSKFADDDLGVFRDTMRLVEKYGWHKGDKFKKWIGSLLERKSGKKDLTFDGLYQLSQKENSLYKELYVVGTNLSTQQAEIYSHETTPNMKIKDAVRISMSIPLYFQAVRNEEGEVLVDGGVTRNYPINLFDHIKYLDNQENGEEVDYNQTKGFIFNHETLGFRLDDEGEKANSMVTNQPIFQDIENIYNYAQALVTFMRQTASRIHLHKNDWNRTIVIDTTGVGVTEFDITKEKIESLIENGQKGVKSHFEWRNNPINNIVLPK